MFNPQNMRLSKNLLSVNPWFQSFKLLKALKEPKQLVNKTEQANNDEMIAFFMI